MDIKDLPQHQTHSSCLETHYWLFCFVLLLNSLLVPSSKFLLRKTPATSTEKPAPPLSRLPFLSWVGLGLGSGHLLDKVPARLPCKLTEIKQTVPTLRRNSIRQKSKCLASSKTKEGKCNRGDFLWAASDQAVTTCLVPGLAVESKGRAAPGECSSTRHEPPAPGEHGCPFPHWL